MSAPIPERPALSSRFRPSLDAVTKRTGDEIVLVHLKTDRIYVLNRTGARLWDLLCADCDRADIERQLLEEMDVGEAELAGALDEILAALMSESLIAPCDAP